MSCVYGPAVGLRIKPPDVGIPLLQTESSVKAVEHIASAE